MARKRMIDPNIWVSEDFGKLSTLAKLIFIGMFSIADDYGYGRANPAYIKSVLFPYDDDKRIADIEKSLDSIAANMSVIFYTHDGKDYYSLTNWNKWQKVEKPSKFRNIPEFGEDSEITRQTVGEDSGNSRGIFPPNKNKNMNMNKNNKKTTSFSSELSADGESSEPQSAKEKPVILLTLNTKEEYPVYQADVDEWSELYPAVDIMQELRNMKGWIQDNPQKRKTKSGIRRFIGTWLREEQKKGSIPKADSKPPNGNKFKNFEERSYDAKELDNLALELLKGEIEECQD